MIKKCKSCGVKHNDCDCFLEYKTFKDDLIECKCLCCNKNSPKDFDLLKKEKFLKRHFLYTYTFSNQDINKFICLLQKVVYPYQYIDDWKKFNEISLPEKESFYSHLNMEDSDYATRIFEDFKIKNLGDYLD